MSQMVKHCQSFPIRSWVDRPRNCESSRYLAFYFQGCQTYFCLPIALSNLGCLIFLIPGTFHLKRWSLSSPCCPASDHFPLNSDPTNLALTGKAEVYLHQTALSSSLSRNFVYKALTII